MVDTIVHLLRHGEVHNPGNLLYGRLPGYGLSELGHRMAETVAGELARRGQDGARAYDIALLVASPLQRAQETAAPVSRALDLPIHTDERLIEATNHFEGMSFGKGEGSLWRPRHWRYLLNPMRPSWGEPYARQAARMTAAVRDARERAAGREALLVSHQLPIWVTRLHCEHRRLWHDPRRRECSLASLTSLHFDGDRLALITYTEPAGELLEEASRTPGA